MIKELDFPQIKIQDDVCAYGGNQEWFTQNWQRQAGCGCVAGTNLAAYYAQAYTDINLLYQGAVNNFTKEEFIPMMEEMFQYMKPGILGYPYIRKFAKQFAKFCKERGVLFDSEIYKKIRSTQDAFHYVKKNIDTGNPVALLVLFHRAKLLREDTWHWMTITGYIDEPDKKQIIRSNYGRRELVDVEVLFEVHSKNIVRMVSFQKKKSGS